MWGNSDWAVEITNSVLDKLDNGTALTEEGYAAALQQHYAIAW
jgi:nucleoside 2-deoxyribosyltransferase